MNLKQFGQMVQEHGGVFRLFNQGVYMKSIIATSDGAAIGMDDVKGGICRALSAAYLTRNWSRAVMNFSEIDSPADLYIVSELSSTLFENGTFFNAFHCGFNKAGSVQRQGKADVGRFAEVKKAFNDSRSNKAQPTAEDEQASAAKAIELLSKGMISPKGGEKTVTLGEARNLHDDKNRDVHTSINADVISNEPGFYFLTVPGHALAACVRNVSGGPVAKFFDPNLGQAVFKGEGSAETMRRFATAFIRRQYGNVHIRVKCFG